MQHLETGETNKPMWSTFMALAANVMQEKVKEESEEHEHTRSSSTYSTESDSEASSVVSSSISPSPVQIKSEISKITDKNAKQAFSGLDSSNLLKPIPLPIVNLAVDSSISNSKLPELLLTYQRNYGVGSLENLDIGIGQLKQISGSIPSQKEYETFNSSLDKSKEEITNKKEITPMELKEKVRQSTCTSGSSRPGSTASDDSSPFDVIELGAKFRNYADFIRVLDAWKEENFHPFRTASSDIFREADGKTREETFKFRYIVFHCVHYGKPRKRGEGKRPNQSYLSCGCRASLRVNYQQGENVLRITSLNTDHEGRHPVTKEHFSKLNTKRRKMSSGDQTLTNTDEPKAKRRKSASVVSCCEKKLCLDEENDDAAVDLSAVNGSGNNTLNLTGEQTVNLQQGQLMSLQQEQLMNLIKNIKENANMPALINPAPNLYNYQQQLAVLQNFHAMQSNLVQKPYLPPFMVPQGPQFGMPQWAYQAPPFNNFLFQQPHNFNLNSLSKMGKDGKPFL